METFLDKVNSFIWSGGLVGLLLLTGALYTIKLKGIQLRLVSFLLGQRREKPRNTGLSQRKTVCMSLGAAMGTGNITGVAAALACGGPGAIFWMWLSAFLGIALVYAENSLASLYSDDESKGPMAYISKGLGARKLAAFFALMCTGAALGMGGMVQVNAFTESLGSCISIRPLFLAAVIFILILAVTSGGVQRIGSAAQLLLPAAAAAYTLICAAVLLRNHSAVPGAFAGIFSSAFGSKQAVGGLSGYALSRIISTGLRRGIFSNEAGLGSSPILHSAAGNSSSDMQGMWSMFEVFFDTFFCCTLTAVVILCAAPDMSVETALSCVLGRFAPTFLSTELCVFAFCTIIGWYYCGETAFNYLTHGRYSAVFCLVFAAAASSGAVFSAKSVWTLSDIFNGLMAFPNLLALILLCGRVKPYKPR